jgi:hypothetical protein
MFSGFQVEFGRNEAGAANTGDTLYRVPVRYGDSSRQVQVILQENMIYLFLDNDICVFTCDCKLATTFAVGSLK